MVPHSDVEQVWRAETGAVPKMNPRMKDALEYRRVARGVVCLSRDANPEDCFAGGGKAGDILRAIDWAQRPVGPVELWPQSLRTALSICLSSRYPICILWGPERTYYYNDAYTPIVGDKHPWALGELYPQVWPEIWESAIRPILEEVERTETACWCDNILLVLRRYGFNEECYFAFSFAPIRVEGGGVGGVFTAITETTRQLVGERRLRTLRDLGARAPEAKSAEEACRIANQVLASNRHDVPFALFYLIESDGSGARCVEALGLDRTSPLCPRSIPLTKHDSEVDVWPLSTVVETGTPVEVRGLTERLGPLPGEPWPEPSHTALVVPLARPGQATPYGFLVAGISPRRTLDRDYESFLTLVAGQVATAISNALAHEEERRRAEALAELDRAKTTFFSNVSHEFRTPLTLMLGPLEDVLGRPAALTAADREQLQVTYRNGLRLLRLVNMLLDFSRIEAGRVQASFEATDLATATRDLASVFRSAVEKAGLKLLIHCAPLSEPVYVDRDMWEKVVLNLVSNAFKFTLQGEIEVTLREASGTAVLSVRDTGTGIPAEELDRIFERFHRIEGARGRTFEGTGIGLALVQELVKLHGGSIAVRSQVGQGTEFTVTLPLGQAHLPPDRIGRGRAAPSTAVKAEAFLEEALRWLPPDEADSAQGASGAWLTPAVPVNGALAPPGNCAATAETSAARIVLADDNADMRDYIRRLLAPRYQVVAVADGEQALTAIRAAPPDLVLADVMMPRCDGFALLRALRADPATQTIPVLLLSARAGEESRVEGLQAGADDYLIKPFSTRELLARVQTRLELARVRMQAAVEIAQAHLRYELVNRATNDVIWDWDPVSSRLHWNDAVVARFGYTLEELGSAIQGRSERIHPEDRNRVEQSIQAAIDGSATTWQDEYRFRCKDGSYRVFLDRGFIARDAQGHATRIIGAMLDITEKKQAAERLEAAVAERTARLRDTIAELEAFSYSISHDMRGPLRAMQGYAHTLLEEAAPRFRPKEREYLSRIARSAQRLDRLIHDVLDYSRLASSEVALEPIDLENLVDEVIQQYPTLQSGQAEIEVCRPLLPVTGHEVLLTQCLSNLLSNALKFVRTEPRGNDVRLWVEDNGIGIAPHNHERVFGIFQRINPDGAYEGTGIGLAIVRKAVTRMGGEVGMTSEAGRGSRFWIQLPAARL